MMDWLLWLWPTSLTTQALLVGVIIGVSAYLLLKKRYRLPPGPKGWPLLGNMLEINKDNPFKALRRYGLEYGPIITVRLGVMKIIVLNRIDVVLEALVKRQADFAGRPQTFSVKAFSENNSDILSANYGPRWKLHRKLASKAIRQYLTCDNISKKLNESLSISVDLMKKQSGPFDPYPYITLAVFNILYGMCFNKLSPDTDDKMFRFYIDNLDEFFKEFGTGLLEDLIPFLQYYPTKKFRKCLHIVKSVNEAIGREVDEHRKSSKPGTTRDFTDALLQAQKEAEEEEDPELLSQITDTHLILTVSNVFFAGIDTSRNTLHWALLAMALHPDIQKKVHKEVDSVIGPDLSVNLADREELPYTEAVIYESMRIRSVVPLGVPHSAMCDTTVGGYEIPKGSMIMINHHALHHDPDQWENSNKFRPERFLDASGKMAPKPESWLPFSAGRRVCLGETLAKPELHLFLAGVMRAFTVSLAPGETHDFEPIPKSALNIPGKYNIVVESRL